jgi:hypothetical protein
MSDATLASFEVDGRWWLAHGTPGAFLVPTALKGNETMDLATATFIADCMCFDHDTPVLVTPAADNPRAQIAPVTPLFPTTASDDARLYADLLGEAVGNAVELRLGFGSIVLRYEGRDPLTRFSKRFAGVEEALGLYAFASRQVDVLGEYLSLYRVLEVPGLSNGKAYIARHLDTLRTHDFGRLEAYGFHAELPLDLFASYRDRALARIATLRGSGLDQRGIAQHLYRIRNGLAHGRSAGSPVLLGRDIDVAAVAQEIPLVKLLARLVVERVP